jgi:hypothetical protein
MQTIGTQRSLIVEMRIEQSQISVELWTQHCWKVNISHIWYFPDYRYPLLVEWLGNGFKWRVDISLAIYKSLYHYLSISSLYAQWCSLVLTFLVSCAAAQKADIDATLLHSYLPRDFVLWIDPFSVAYRVGDHGNIMTLFEDRSRGRITFKVDPATNNPEMSNGSPALNQAAINGAFKSPVNSPRLQHLQPRSNAVRITPPNSPEKNDLANKKSRGQTQPQTSQQQAGAQQQEQQSQQLVLANWIGPWSWSFESNDEASNSKMDDLWLHADAIGLDISEDILDFRDWEHSLFFV